MKQTQLKIKRKTLLVFKSAKNSQGNQLIDPTITFTVTTSSFLHN